MSGLFHAPQTPNIRPVVDVKSERAEHSVAIPICKADAVQRNRATSEFANLLLKVISDLNLRVHRSILSKSTNKIGIALFDAGLVHAVGARISQVWCQQCGCSIDAPFIQRVRVRSRVHRVHPFKGGVNPNM